MSQKFSIYMNLYTIKVCIDFCSTCIIEINCASVTGKKKYHKRKLEEV